MQKELKNYLDLVLKSVCLSHSNQRKSVGVHGPKRKYNTTKYVF